MATYNADLNVSGTLTVPSGIFSDSVTVSGASVLTSESVVGGGGSALTVKEIDGSPSVANVDTIVVSDGTLTDDGGGQVTITTGGTSGGGAASGDFSGAWVILSGTTFNVPNSTVKFLPFDHAIYDTDNWFTAVSGEALKVPAGKGITHVQAKAQVDWESSGANGNFTLIIRKNYENIDNVVIRAEQEVNAADLQQQIASPPLPVVDGDELQLLVYQNSGVSIDIDNTPTTDLFRTWFSIEDITPRGSTSSGTGGIPTTTSGSYWVVDAPPEFPNAFNDEFDTFTGDPTHVYPWPDPDPAVWTLWDPQGDLKQRSGLAAEGIGPNGLGFSKTGTTPAWGGYVREIAPMTATITGVGTAYWFETKVSLSERESKGMLAGICIGGDLIGNPTTEEILYIALGNNLSAVTVTSDAQHIVAGVTNGVAYNAAISTNSEATPASGPQQTHMYLRVGFGNFDTYTTQYSSDGNSWSILANGGNGVASGTLNFTPQTVGLVMRAEDAGGCTAKFQYFRFQTMPEATLGSGHITMARLPILGRRVFADQGIVASSGSGGGSGDGNITDINAQEGPSITITGAGGINTITEGNVITVSGGAANIQIKSRDLLYEATGATHNSVHTVTSITDWQSVVNTYDVLRFEAQQEGEYSGIRFRFTSEMATDDWNDNSANIFYSWDSAASMYFDDMDSASNTFRVQQTGFFNGTSVRVYGLNYATDVSILVDNSFNNLFHAEDIWASTTGQQGFTASTWTTRRLNTLSTDRVAGASLVSNQITLPPGTYYTEWNAPAYNVSHHKTRLRDIDNSVNIMVGTNGYTDASNFVMTNSVGSGRFTLTETTTLELQHHCSSTNGTNGLSAANNISGTDERYAEIRIWSVQTVGAFVEELTVASGTFTESLTISGVPVATGTGGGGAGNITDINAQTGPSVTVTGVGNISTTTVGNVITVSGVDTVDLRSKNYSGALVSRESGSTQAISGNTTVTWSDERIDTDGFFDSGDNTRLTIPAGLGIKKIRLTALARIVPSDTPTTTEYITSQIYKNGTNLPDDPRIVYRHPHIFANGIDVSLPYITPALTVVDGDYFELIIATNVGGSPVVSNIRSWFEIEVVERDSPLALTEFTAVSGTFTDSLTVSGVPVNIGAGGGPGTITDINTVAIGPSVTITGAGGIDTITEGNVITVSGAGNFSPGFRGAWISSTSGTSTTTAVGTDWGQDKVIRDTDGFWDPDLARIVIPAGVKKVKVQAAVAWTSNTVGARIITIKHTSTAVPDLSVSNNRQQAITTGGLDTMQETSTNILDVSEGDQFYLRIYQNSGSTLVTEAQGDFLGMSLEVVDPAPVPGFVGKQGFKGALIQRTTGQTFTTGTNIPVEWQTTEYDIGGWFNIGEDDTYFTVPEGVTKVKATSQLIWGANTTGIRVSQIQIDTGGGFTTFVGQGFRRFNALTDGSYSRVDVNETAAFSVTAGDKIRVLGFHTKGSDLDINGGPQTWFAIEAIETNENFQIDEFTAASGTFTQSLTISGVPVSTGTGGGGGAALTVKEADGDPLVANVDTIVVTNGTLTDDGSGQVTIDTGGSTIGGIPTTASGAYWSAFAPPEYPSPFDDEFDTFTDDSIGQTPLDSPSDAWTAWSPASNGPFMRNAFGEGIEAAGFGFSHLGAATPTWQGYIRPLGEMVATTSGGQSYWIDTHVSMAERDTIRGLGGIILGGDLISSPTTEKFIYIALENNVAATVENTSQSQIRYASNGVDYNDALSTNTVYTDASGPNTTSMHLRLMYDALNNGYSMSYSTDGSAFSIASSTVIASGSLNFTPSVVGLVGRAEDTFGGWLTRFSHFRFRKANDRESGVSQITLNRTPVNGRQIYTNPVAAIPSDLIAASGTFSDSLTISGVPVSTGTGGGGASTLQEAYDGGDGVITTTAGKPLSIVGDEYDGNVDFKVTGSGQFTESLQVGSGTTFITGEMIETPSLFVDGNPLSASTVSTPQAVTTSGVIGKKLGMTHSPVALWLFENDLIDSSGNGLDLTKRAGPELYMSNHGLRCIKFDGVAHFAHTTTGTALEITGDITIELLLSVDQITTQGYLLSYSSDSSGSAANNVLYSLNYTVGNETLAALHHSGSETQHNFDSEAAGIDALHHLVMVRKNGDYTIYMDGMKIGDSSADFPDAASGTSSFFQLGALRAGFIWTGSIACVKVIDSALTADQVYAEFESTWATSEIEFPNVASNNSPFQTLDTSLAPLALYTLDGTITDTAGGTSPTLTVDAGTELYSSAGQPGIQMAYFDGSTQYSAPDAATRLLGDMTAECFIYVPTVPVSISAVILNCQGTSGGGETDNAIYNWVLQTTGEIRWNQQNGNQTSSAYDFSGVRMPIGETVHMAVTRQSDVLRLYINGILMDISPAQTTPTGGSDSDFHISGNRANTNRLQVGTRLGSVKIFDRALTQAEIKSESDRLFGMSAFSAGGQVVTAVSGTFSQSLTVSGVPVDITGGGGGGGAALTVKEADGVPTVANVDTIVVTNGTLTDDGSGQVTLDTGGSGGSIPSNSEFSGAVVTTTTGITVPTSPGFVYIPWDEVIFDETGWRSSDVNELVVPSGVTHVQAELALRWTGSTAGYRNIQIHLNENNVGQLKEDTISSSVTTMFHQVSTPPLKVAPGDVFTARAVQNTGGNLDLLEDTVDRVYFSVTALNRGLSDYITAVSGTFADSLTVSGVPVNIGAGGGAAPTTISGIIGNKLNVTTISGVALYLFDDNLTDSSGNGLDLSLGAGAERYTNVNGLRSIKMDGNSYFRYTPGSSALEITGDITIQLLLTTDEHVGTAYMLSYAGGGDAESTNALFTCRIGASQENYDWFTESGAGVDASYGGWGAAGNQNIHLLTYVRESDIVTLYIDGAKRGSSGTLATPTGGTSSKLDVGAFDGSSIYRGTMSCIKIVNSALTATQVYDEYKTTWATLV